MKNKIKPTGIPSHYVPSTRTCKQVTLPRGMTQRRCQHLRCKSLSSLKGVNILIISAIALAIAVLVVAQTSEELQEELNQLEQELTDANYSWLINYSGNIKIHNIMY